MLPSFLKGHIRGRADLEGQTEELTPMLCKMRVYVCDLKGVPGWLRRKMGDS